MEDPEEWEQLDSDEALPAAQEGALLQAPPNPNILGTSPSAPRRSRESVRSTRPPQPPQQQPPEIPDVEMLLDTPPEFRTQQQQQQPPSTDPTIAALAAAAAAAAAATVSAPLPSNNPFSQHSTSPPMPIPAPASAAQHRALAGDINSGRHTGTRTPSPTGGGPVGVAPGGRNGVGVSVGHEGPITPRNDAGPWVFDGSGVRLSSDGGGRENGVRVNSMSLEAAVQASGGASGGGSGSGVNGDVRMADDEVL